MIKKITRYFNGLKLHIKLLLSYLLVILLPVISIGAFLIYRTTDNIMAHEEYTSQINSKQIATNIEDKLNDLLQITINIYYEDDLMEHLQTVDPQADTLEKYNRYKRQLDRYSKRFPITVGSLTTLSIYTTNTSILQDEYFIIHVTDSIRSQPWYQEAFEAKGQSIFIEPFIREDEARNIGGNRFLSIVRLLNPYSKSQIDNVLKLDIPEMELYRLFETEGINKDIYVLNQDNTIVSSTTRDSFGKKADTVPILKDILKTRKDNGKTYYDGNKNAVYFYEIKSNSAIYKWKIITVVSSQTLLGKIHDTVNYSVFICLIIVVVTIVFVYFFSNTLTKRLKLLVMNMSKVSEGKFEVFVDCEGKDEISELARDFKIMVEKVNTLINEVYILDIKKKEAEFNALQSQINPHFLFNTMESIRMNLWNRQDYETSEVIQQFAMLLRKSIERTEDIITIKREIELVGTYLEIQKYRYREKLEYEIDIPEEILANVIPKFSLQPLVENAIYHGISLKKGKGFLRIGARKTEEGIEVLIEDDGIGIEEDKLQRIREQLADSNYMQEKGRIGVANVHQRIRLYFGNHYGLTISSSKGEGTEITILLPDKCG
jgi:two-component system sensor histidine kinase YesM